ncbi:MAG: hypothetical protein FWG30_03450 [Eubacteriaceae bacterium]|nr:hypothetical protein [Eubacteriaceae bacterium]
MDISEVDFAALSNQAQEGKVSHAYLFYGAEEFAQRRAIHEFICLIATKSTAFDVQLIRRNLQSGQQPNVIEIDGSSASIKIGDIRDVIRFFSTTSLKGEIKYACLYGAQTMTEQAQNALLKTVEEPFDGCRVLLGSKSREGLLSTLLSRLSPIKLNEAYTAEGSAFLGSKLESILFEANDSLALLAAQQLSDDRPSAIAELESLCAYFSGLMSQSIPDSGALVSKLPKATQMKLLNLALSAISYLRQNVSVQLTIECMFIQMQEVCHAESSRRPL